MYNICRQKSIMMFTGFECFVSSKGIHYLYFNASSCIPEIFLIEAENSSVFLIFFVTPVPGLHN